MVLDGYPVFILMHPLAFPFCVKKKLRMSLAKWAEPMEMLFMGGGAYLCEPKESTYGCQLGNMIERCMLGGNVDSAPLL